MRKNLDKLKALRMGDQAVFLHNQEIMSHLVKPAVLNKTVHNAYCLLLLNLEGVCKPVTRVDVLPLVLRCGSETRGFVCLPVQAAEVS